MLRRLFACLALLTGLAAAGAPAQAHLSESGIARIEAGLCEAAGEVEKAKAGYLPVQAIAHVRDVSTRPLARGPTHFYPSVYLGIDRARE